MPLLLALGLLPRIQLEILGVQPLALAQLGKELGRVDLISGVARQAHHLQQELLLCVPLHKCRRCPHLDVEISLDALVVAVGHHPVEVTLDVRARHIVIKPLCQAAQNAGGIVVLHLHAAQRVRGIATDSLQHGGHAGGVLGHLQAEVDDVHQLGLHTRHHKSGKSGAHV